MDVTVDLNSGTAVVGEQSTHGVSWAAIAGGAFAAAGLGFMLVSLGTGLGLSAMSPRSANPSMAKFSIAAAIWLTLTQLIAAALGGYLAGRLRTRWTGVHVDEVHFRDTAHGLIVWAVGAVISAALLASAGTSVVSGGARTMAAMERSDAGSTYFVDEMFRGTRPEIAAVRPLPTAEVAGILAVSLRNGEISPEDRTYLAEVIVSRTGVTETEAEQRVDAAINQAKAAADAARKTAAALAIWAAIALLVGAFSASYAATIGGRARDRV